MVLLHLVSGGAGAILRSKCAAVADIAGPEYDHRPCVIYQHGNRGLKQGETGALAGDSIVPDAVLRLEFFRLGKGKGFALIFSPRPSELITAVGFCALLCGTVLLLKCKAQVVIFPVAANSKLVIEEQTDQKK